jgi:hypothetical protein
MKNYLVCVFNGLTIDDEKNRNKSLILHVHLYFEIRMQKLPFEMEGVLGLKSEPESLLTSAIFFILTSYVSFIS